MNKMELSNLQAALNNEIRERELAQRQLCDLEQQANNGRGCLVSSASSSATSIVVKLPAQSTVPSSVCPLPAVSFIISVCGVLMSPQLSHLAATVTESIILKPDWLPAARPSAPSQANGFYRLIKSDLQQPKFDYLGHNGKRASGFAALIDSSSRTLFSLQRPATWAVLIACSIMV
ncbi:unnamed protein product [Schistocephalus solidus]|uniref:Uncharacterized protein n=1 Tax=Schistocephalus solidus TaxID=70667 RepID=A0A183SYX0_SCHSO|nr:unnamed protein product [Schistocephalus solidus]